MGKIDPEAGNHPVALPLEQDPGKLGAPEQEVVRPLEHEPGGRRRRLDRADQREAGGEREAARLRIAGLEPDERRSVEIAGRAFPVPILPPTPAVLPRRDQPVALMGVGGVQQVGVGRARPLDETNARQRAQNTLAALAARSLKGRISR
ncbi:hypothetical protein GCM10007925_22840 [Sphingomonas astaxanthinifaciens DSM 22298]|uniref:Uncharacterized protein n=1 Tax=Sphingomonas astaxanthinifaciens DSM 22298 TaxID=1123267 RepID=A0ABQ5ZA68_9SPHN|nr:hypothetical protein GCM10007925_22840 [Sphingomonas astaxanthinifaciens DSM 22298]